MVYQIYKQAISIGMFIEFRFTRPYQGNKSGLKGRVRGIVTYPYVPDKTLAATEYQRMLSGLSDAEKLLADLAVSNATFLIIEDQTGTAHYISPDWIMADSILADTHLYALYLQGESTVDAVKEIMGRYGYSFVTTDVKEWVVYVAYGSSDRKEAIELILNNRGFTDVTVNLVAQG